MDGARGLCHARVGAGWGPRRRPGVPLALIGVALGVGGCERPGVAIPPSSHAEAHPVQTAWVTTNGLSACLVTDGAWIESNPARLTLRLRNDTTGVLVVRLLDTIGVSSLAADGTWVPADGGRNGTAPGIQSIRLAPGESFDVDRQVRIVRGTNGRAEVIGSDGFGGSWAIRRVAPGPLTLRMAIDEASGAPASSEPRVWTGSLVTPGVSVAISPADAPPASGS